MVAAAASSEGVSDADDEQKPCAKRWLVAVARKLHKSRTIVAHEATKFYPFIEKCERAAKKRQAASLKAECTG
jgi:hypothetical protein